jgi:hypothetical protein
MVASIIDEAGARVKEEIDNIKQQYNKKLEILLHDMKRIEGVGNYILLYLAPTYIYVLHGFTSDDSFRLPYSIAFDCSIHLS